MNRDYVSPTGRSSSGGFALRARAFTLIELLTVMFIMSLLIAILIPSLNSARNSAKKTATAQTLKSIKAGLELFRTENGREFPQTNGYPPSFAHPPIPGYTFDPLMGQFPFLQQQPPVVYGAHWLPAMLMGVDQQGYVSRRSVPRKKNLRKEPWKWYTQDPTGDGKPLERRSLYLDPSTIKTTPTEDLPGAPNLNFFPDWDVMKQLPVIIDSFDQPILYYAANNSGTPRNMTAGEREPDNNYTGGIQENGPPYYVHQDNHGFTGDGPEKGWDFSGKPHRITLDGDALDAAVLADPSNALAPQTFAYFILDRKQLRTMRKELEKGNTINPQTPLRPSNPDSYLLISAGVDGRYGTPDDVTNFPLSTE